MALNAGSNNKTENLSEPKVLRVNSQGKALTANKEGKKIFGV